jgi:polyisoprenoid-binding protein YceI
VDGITYQVTSIANNAFAGNKKLTSVTIGKNITKIGKNAFKNCKKLKKITVKSTQLTKKSIGKNALKGTNKNLTIKVPKKKVSDYKKYFKGKGNKTVKVKK